MTKREALNGKPYAGNPHVRFDEGEAASTATSRRGSLLYNTGACRKYGVIAAALCVSAAFATAQTTDWAQLSGEVVIPAGETWYADESDMTKVNALTSITVSGAVMGESPADAATLVFRNTTTVPKTDLLLCSVTQRPYRRQTCCEARA